MKNYTPEIKQAIADGMPIVSLLAFNLVQGTTRLTSAAHDIIYNHNTYLASGLLLDIPSKTDSRQLEIDSFTIEISAADPTMLAFFSNANQMNRKVTVKEVILDEEHKVIGELVSKSFIITSWSDSDSEKDASIAVELTNWISYLKTIRGIRTTQNSFARFYPNTTSFINAKDLDLDKVWGGE